MLSKVIKKVRSLFKNNMPAEKFTKDNSVMSKILDKSSDDEICAQDIMFSRADLKFVRLSDSIETILELFANYNDNCIPVVENHDIIGVITFNDMMKCSRNKDHWSSYMKKVTFLAENSNINNVLLLLNNWPLIVVMDEFCNGVGVITKQIFADTIIEKVYLIHQSNNKEMILLGDTNLDEVSNIINLEPYNTFNVDTISAFVICLFDKIPMIGEKIFIGDYEIEVLDADRKYIKSIKIIKKHYQLS